MIPPGFVQPGNRAGDACGHRTEVLSGRRVLACFVEPHFGMRAGRCRFPEVVRICTPLVRLINQEPAAADVAGLGVGHRQGEGGGHRGIDGVAAGEQHLGAHIRGNGALGNHHAMLGSMGGAGPYRRLADKRQEEQQPAQSGLCGLGSRNHQIW